MWEFWIDVGGTFTDCIARSPSGVLHHVKTLSSGITRGTVDAWDDAATFLDPLRGNDPESFWTGYSCCLIDCEGLPLGSPGIVDASASGRGAITLSSSLPAVTREKAVGYELRGGEEAPIVAIRKALELRLNQPVPPVRIRLGTTRGTNALLTRTGARTALVTTRGFADVLRIANQDRPRLFDLSISKPTPLFECVVEIDERLDAEGTELKACDPIQIRQQLQRLYATGIESVAICLLHSFANPGHEKLVEHLAREVGFEEISTSSRLTPLIKIVSRGDTTVVDAYLNPILRRYVCDLKQSLDSGNVMTERAHDSVSRVGETVPEFLMMTSAGGLVEAEAFVGKDSILSGPAGGVIGFSGIAQAAGFERAIGFDMGGTSTDVSRFDGRCELEYETVKAGVRIVSPMLAIETVAAGGGSICGFDGVKLHVGPESAGADPGPACYGAGGPLTVTDLNVYLGRILPERFPFPLDRAAVGQRLEELCVRIEQSPLGKKYTPGELAEGYLAIANANMVRAIRRISVARGYNPADYVLVSFGGAGAQHACAVARELGIPGILIHPFAGILSAYGMGLADVRKFRETSVLAPWTEASSDHILSLFAQMAAEARAEIQSEGIPDHQIDPPRPAVDVRYRGAESTLTVDWPSDGDLRAAFEAEHQRLYGYVHSDRELEVTVARVEVVGRIAIPEWPVEMEIPREPDPEQIVTTRFGGREQPTNVYCRDRLRPGDRVEGPAIIWESTSTIVVDPGFTARVTERHDLLVSDNGTSGETSSDRSAPMNLSAPDPVMLEIFNNLFASVAEQMGVTLQQTSFSTNVKERLDFSCAVFSPAGELVVNAPHIPVHLGAMSETVQRTIEDHPRIQPGDVFVTNDPYRGGSHLPDVTVVTPVHDPSTGALIFFTASRAHHAEIGGIVPGSMPPFSTNLAEEGVLIRNMRLVDSGDSCESEVATLLRSGPWPSRCIHDNLADLSAQVAANRMGAELLGNLIERHGLSMVHAYMHHIQIAASEKMRIALRQKGDGVYRFRDHLDDGATIHVSISVRNGSAKVDFAGTSPVLASNLNANRAITTAAVLYVFRCMINEEIPLNSGVLAPVEISLPECFLNPPAHERPEDCAAIVGGNVETSQRIVDVLFGALELAAASQGTMNNLTFGDASFGYYETICGGSGATDTARGADAVHSHMTNTRLTDVEVIERRYPVRIEEFRIRRNSGGAGQRRGGDGVVRCIRFLKSMRVSMISQRRGTGPYGMAGGSAGSPGLNLLDFSEVEGVDASDSIRDAGPCFSEQMPAGSVLRIETPGGGGWGNAD